MLADRVERAESFVERLRGVMFRSSLPEGFAMVFPGGASKRRGVHTAFVQVPIDVVWTDDGRVRRVEQMAPWRLAVGVGDRIVEFPAGAATELQEGDELRVEDGGEDRG